MEKELKKYRANGSNGTDMNYHFLTISYPGGNFAVPPEILPLEGKRTHELLTEWLKKGIITEYTGIRK